MNVFVSSGDAGSNPDMTGQLPVGPVQVEYAASDPSVIAVGGTTLVLAPDGSVASETAWAGGGGGKSIFFPRPSWQTGVSDDHHSHLSRARRQLGSERRRSKHRESGQQHRGSGRHGSGSDRDDDDLSHDHGHGHGHAYAFSPRR